MDPADSTELERLLDRELKGLPAPQAPRTLLPRVMEAAARGQVPAAPATGWSTWSPAWQAASIAVLLLMVATVSWLFSAPPAQVVESDADGRRNRGGHAGVLGCPAAAGRHLHLRARVIAGARVRGRLGGTRTGPGRGITSMRTIRLYTALALALWVGPLLGTPVSAQTTPGHGQRRPPRSRRRKRRRRRLPRSNERHPRSQTSMRGRAATTVRSCAWPRTTRWRRATGSGRSGRVFGDVVIEGRVEQDVVVVMGSIRLASSAVVDGSVVGDRRKRRRSTRMRWSRDDLVVVGGTLRAAPTFSPGGEHIVIGSPWMGETLRDLLPWMTRGCSGAG